MGYPVNHVHPAHVRRCFPVSFGIGVGLLTCLLLGNWCSGRPRIDLNGHWDFYPDVGNATLDAITAPPATIIVPGAWQAQGFGSAGGTIPSANIGPGRSPADYLRHNLMARCLYVRAVAVPAEWRGSRIFLTVRRAYRYTDAAVNGVQVGTYEGFSTPFEFEVTRAVRCGQTNQIVLGVDNRPRPGLNTLGTANLNGNWGGIGGDVALEARPPNFVQDVFAIPQLAKSRVLLRCTMEIERPRDLAGCALKAVVTPWKPTNTQTASRAEAALPPPAENASTVTVDLAVALTDWRPWTPDDPFLYEARVTVLRRGKAMDEISARFGMREIVARGDKLFLNGHPLYLAGYGDDATEPLTGMLPADKAVYLHRLSLMRRLGFNFVRHHSCVPHDEYLEAADEVGMLVQPEASMAYTGFWPTGYRLFENEWPGIVRAFRNHPCIWAWCMGNELFLDQLPKDAPAAVDRRAVTNMLATAYRQAKELDPTRLIHASDGGTPQPYTDILSAGGRAAWGVKPRLLHEYGAYCCSLPDLELVSRLNGVIEPLTYERAARYVREHQLENVYSRLYRSSLQMRADAQKHYMETARADGANSGYSFWLGVDFPESPEGCWDEGVLNQLWEPKPGLTNGLADINAPTVLLTTAGLDRRTFYSGEGEQVGIRLWHYGSKPVRNARLAWRLRHRKTTFQTGERAVPLCAPGATIDLGSIDVVAPETVAPSRVTLEVELSADGHRLARNAWEFFAYPRPGQTNAIPGVYSEIAGVPGAALVKDHQPLPSDLRLLITHQLKRERHGALLQRGHAAVLLLGTGGFQEIRAGYFLNQHGAGFGGIIQPHPVFDQMPHEGMLNLGLYQLVAGGGLLEASSMPAPLRDGAVVWGLRLTGWISPVKNLGKVVHYCDVLTDQNLHLVLCNLNLLSDRPECRYVLGRTIAYLLSGRASPITAHCAASALEGLMP